MNNDPLPPKRGFTANLKTAMKLALIFPIGFMSLMTIGGLLNRDYHWDLMNIIGILCISAATFVPGVYVILMPLLHQDMWLSIARKMKNDDKDK